MHKVKRLKHRFKTVLYDLLCHINAVFHAKISQWPFHLLTDQNDLLVLLVVNEALFNLQNIGAVLLLEFSHDGVLILGSGQLVVLS